MDGAAGSLLLSQQEIERRVAEMGRQISSDFAGRTVTIIGILKGSFIFVADLIRRLDRSLRAEVDFISVASYGNSTSSAGVVQMGKDIEIPVAGKDVLLVEDIIDTGLTLTYVHGLMIERGARSVRVAALLEKAETRKYAGVVDYVGFKIPNRFVVGYGLDYAQLYRNLPEIRILDDV